MKKDKVVGAALWGIFILFISHKLFQDSIRYDEAVEYYISLSDFGNMFELARKTFQPPLYNILMHFWLMINSSGEWFRVFNMVCCVAGSIALHKTVRIITGKKEWGYIAIFISVCFCSYVYYNQIGGEYTLLLCLISWCIYFFAACLYNMSFKKILGWIIFCVLAMYTQYGAFIPILSMGILLFALLLFEKRWKEMKQFIVSSVVAGVIPGGLLCKYFLLEQMEHQGTKIELIFSIDRIMQEPIEAIRFLIYAFSIRHTYRNMLIGILFAFIIFCILISQKDSIKEFWNKNLTILLLNGIVTWCIYCISTWLGVYGYGIFGSRHTLAILPVFIYCVTILSWTLYKIIQGCRMKKWMKNTCNVALVMILLIYMYSSFSYINEHWNYQQDDVAYEIWDENVNEDTITYVYWYCAPQFLYYQGADEKEFFEYYINKEYQDGNVIYPKSFTDMSYDEFREKFIDTYGLLKNRYIFISMDESTEINNVLALFDEEGYETTSLLDADTTKVYLFER